MRLFLEESCWDSIMSLPRDIQNKFKEFRRKFKENPKSAAINLESISSFKDDSLRTARLGLEYRMIIGVVGNDDYCLLHIDHHDEAMAWAQNKKFIWNDQISSFQVISVEHVQEHAAVASSQSQEYKAFSAYSDDKLLRIGVPSELLPLVRSFKDLDDLDRYEKELPQDVWENLYYLLDSGDIDRIIYEVEEGKRKNEEHEKQLQSENNRRRFIDITEDEDLERILKEDLKQWMVFLHPSQRRLVDGNYSGSLKVSGGGGTGKTVAAIHRLKRLCTETYEGWGKVLYTAYNRALVDNLAVLIRQMDVPNQRFELATVDKLSLDIAKANGIISNNTICLLDDKRIHALWQEVVMDNMSEFSAEFLQSEYVDIILYNDVQTLDQYLKTPRTGQGNALSRKQRKNVWEMVEKFCEVKQKQHIVERNELFNLVARWLNENEKHPYTHVIADEIQDLSNPELRFLRALTPEGPNDLFLVGDPYQRIYSRKLNFKQAGINIQGRSRRLRVNYRTTEEIKRHAVSIVSGIEADDFDGNAESLKGYVSLLHGEAPVYQLFANKNQEFDAIVTYINQCLEAGIRANDICVASYRNDSVDSIANYLTRNAGIPCRLWNRGDKDGVHAYTFHRMKGLEFRVVILADVSAGTIPYRAGNYNELDDEQKRQIDQSQRSLMYVALTRAINRVFITGCGEPSSFLTSLAKK